MVQGRLHRRRTAACRATVSVSPAPARRAFGFGFAGTQRGLGRSRRSAWGGPGIGADPDGGRRRFGRLLREIASAQRAGSGVSTGGTEIRAAGRAVADGRAARQPAGCRHAGDAPLNPMPNPAPAAPVPSVSPAAPVAAPRPQAAAEPDRARVGLASPETLITSATVLEQLTRARSQPAGEASSPASRLPLLRLRRPWKIWSANPWSPGSRNG